jgi:DNA polymerase (family X)
MTRATAFPGNARLADRLREAAALLEAQGASPFRVAAYRRAAETLLGLGEESSEILRAEGPSGLEALPGIGPGIAAALAEMVRTGRWMQLERLRGSADPPALFRSIPGVGPELAQRMHETLHVDTLEALEIAAHDGRLETVPGLGPRRTAAIRASLAAMLGRARIAAAFRRPAKAPSVPLVLAVDRAYREAAAAGQLARIAPRRFNPSGEAWLPVLHTSKDGWHFTALYSNTARAHELGRTRDWVVVYFYDDDHAEGQHTVVTETRGPLAGRRVVRGREAEYQELIGTEPRES